MHKMKTEYESLWTNNFLPSLFRFHVTCFICMIRYSQNNKLPGKEKMAFLKNLSFLLL